MARDNDQRPLQVQINQAQNGYVVEEGINNGSTVFDPKVFQTKAELIDYIEGHFTHEATNLLTDPGE